MSYLRVLLVLQALTTTTVMVVTPVIETASLDLTLTAASPSLLLLSWEFDPPLNRSTREQISYFKIQVNDINSDYYIRAIVPASFDNITLRPMEPGSFTRISVYAFNASSYPLGSGVSQITMPACDTDRFCIHGQPAGFACSHCVCTSSAFSGLNCNNPEFYPHNVAVWPIAPTTLHVEWEYNKNKHRQALRRSGLEAVQFFINVSDGIADFNYSIPIQSKSVYSFNITQIQSGVLYTVVVSTVAEGRSGAVTVLASAPSVKTLIPNVPSCPEPTSSMPGNHSPSWQVAGSIIGGVAMVTALLVAVCSVGFTALYCIRRSQKHQKDRIGHHRALNPHHQTAISPHHQTAISPHHQTAISPHHQTAGSINTTRLQANPAYGQLATSNTVTINGSLRSDSGTGGSYVNASGTNSLTYDYIPPN